ncbi:MAG: hypothetical protein WCG66_04925 [bacterium]
MNQELAQHPGWKWCTFEGAELHSLLLGLETTLREKIIWMEEMEGLHKRFEENRIKRLGEQSQSKAPQS